MTQALDFSPEYLALYNLCALTHSQIGNTIVVGPKEVQPDLKLAIDRPLYMPLTTDCFYNIPGKSMFNKKPFLNSVTAKLALAAVATCVASPAALAAVICSTVNLSVPATGNLGVYLNLVTGATSTTGPVTGWDINPYNNGNAGSGGFQFYLPTDGSGVVGGPTPPPSNANATGGTASVVTAGTLIGPASVYSGANQVEAAAAFRAAGTNFAGIRFLNGAVINYGWMEFTTSAGAAGSAGFPATLTRFCYQNDGSAINAGTTPVALQKFSVD